MLQIAAGRFERRHLGNALRRSERKNGGGPVDARMREPGFRGRYQAAGNFGPAPLCQRAYNEGGRVIPGKRRGSSREIGWCGQIEERGQQRLFTDLAGVNQLGDFEQRHGGLLARIASLRRVGESAVGGSKVDSDDVLAWQARWALYGKA